MTTNLHDKMLAAIDALFSASNEIEAHIAEEQLLDVRDELLERLAQQEAAPKVNGINDLQQESAMQKATPQAQPAREWVDLTVTEQNELCRELGASRHQVRAIGAKLKEKNT